MKFCRNCGNELRDEAVMCPKCGEEVDIIPPQAPEQKATKFCTYCGAEVLQAAVICPKCGCPLRQEKRTQTKNNYLLKSSRSTNGLQIAAKVFMVLGCIMWVFLACAMAILGIIMSNSAIEIATQLGATYLVMAVIYLLPLAWCFPMTSYYFSKTANKEEIGTGFKICTLLFVNLIAGILMLCDNKNNQ